MEALQLLYWHYHCDTPCMGGENDEESQGEEKQEPGVVQQYCVVFNWESPYSSVPISPIQGENTEDVNYFLNDGNKLYLSLQRDWEVAK